MSSLAGSVFLSIILVGLIGWQIGIQVQVSHVDSAVPPLSFMKTNTSQHVYFFTTSTSPEYVSSVGINNNSFLFVCTIDKITTLSGLSKSFILVFTNLGTTFVGDGVTAASLTINLPDQSFVVGGVPVNLPVVYAGAGVSAVGRAIGSLTIPSEITMTFVPPNGASTQNWSSMILSFTTDYT